MTRQQDDIRRCPDDGRCWHGCIPSVCYRVRSCGPLSGVFPEDEWPRAIVAEYGERFDVTVAGFDFRRQITVKAGRRRVEHVVPPAGERYAFDVDVWDHSVVVAVSPTGRSVRVFIDGDEVSK